MKSVDFTSYLESDPIVVSVPCRIDMGGTLDITTFHYPLQYTNPCTFNIAVGLRTTVRLYPFRKGITRVSSRGIGNAEFPLKEAPFNHPLGLMLAAAARFGADGIHIDIDSSSPPRSALGGSSSAAVALVAGLMKICNAKDGEQWSADQVVILAHSLESSVAGVPCGMQDQLAAAYGGVNAWYWTGRVRAPYLQKAVMSPSSFEALQKHILVAYCGIPHESSNINGQWVQQFVAGRYRTYWETIAALTHRFVQALEAGDYRKAAEAMNQETEIRTEMTPDVLDDMGYRLVENAIRHHCGARFTGAGGGGCVWAVGDQDDIRELESDWKRLLKENDDACLLDVSIDPDGLKFH